MVQTTLMEGVVFLEPSNVLGGINLAHR